MKTLLFLVIALSAPLAAHADENFRCGQKVASSSMPLSEFISKCGAPTSKVSRTEDVKARNPNTGLLVKVGETTIETWTYDRGTRGAAMVVTIIDGKIKSIERQR
jgi:hypothetical protein